MIKSPILSALAILIMFSLATPYESLRELYDQALPSGEYDKYVELDPAIEYTGDLVIVGDGSIRLIGNGAIIHGNPSGMSVYVYNSTLEISGCIFVDGAYGVYLSGNTSGSIYNNTIINCTQQGIAYINQDYTDGVYIWNNIICGSRYGLLCLENYHPDYIGYNTVWSTGEYRYAEQCLD